MDSWGLFQKATTQILHSLWNAPDPEPASTVKALLNRVPSSLPRLHDSNPPAMQGTSRQVGKFNRAGRDDCRWSRYHPLGLSWDEFQGFTAAPWNAARLCGLLKETPTALVALFHGAKLIPIC